MNQRIRELALQVDLMRYPSDGINTQIEKFAELIVQECASACLHDDWEDPRWGRFYAKKIQEHFGVEK